MSKIIDLELGGIIRHLKVDFNALAAAEGVAGKSMFDAGTWENTSATQVRAFVWALLLHESPDLKIEEVGGWLEIDNIEEVGKAIAEALQGATTGGGSPLAEAPAVTKLAEKDG